MIKQVKRNNLESSD